MVSSSKSSNSTSSTNQTYDERVIADQGAQVFRNAGDVYQETLDGGAIEEMGEVAIEAFRSAGDLGSLAGDISRDSIALAGSSLARTNEAFETFADKTRTDQAQFFDQLITYGIPALALSFIAWRYFR
jgi:hypothetical protein